MSKTRKSRTAKEKFAMVIELLQRQKTFVALLCTAADMRLVISMGQHK